MQEFITQLMDAKLVKLLEFLVNHADQEFYLREIAKQTKLPVATVFRMLNKLHSLNIVNVRQIKNTKLYSINKQNEKLIEVFSTKKTALEFFVEQVSKIAGVIMVIQLLSKDDKKDKANILILGSNIDPEAVKQCVVAVKQRYNFTITQLTLEPSQYKQMLDMGLYPGRKQVLYAKHAV